MAGVLLFARVSKASHMASKVPNGIDTVAKPPGYNVGIKPGYYSLTAGRTTSITNIINPVPKHAQTPSLPTPPLGIPG